MSEVFTCANQVNSGAWCQESYETESKQAGKRARALRKLGYVVSTFAMGAQVTKCGVVKLTMVDIRPGANADTFGLPTVNKLSI